MAGIRHRDFDAVMLLLVPDGEPGDQDWYGTERTPDERPTRPILLFYTGERPTEQEALHWLSEHGHDSENDSVPFPKKFEDFGSHDAIRSIMVYLSYPPCPWLEEAKLGMEMGRCFGQVELTDWTDPSESQPGVYCFRFFREADRDADSDRLDIHDEDLPF